MRTSILLGALGCLGLLHVACTSDTSIGAPPAAPVDWHGFDVPRVVDAGTVGATAQERATADAYLTALAAPGMTALGALLNPDSHFAFPGTQDTRGKDAILKAHDALFGAFDGRAIAASRVWRTDTTAAVEWTMSGTQARDWMGVPASHKPVVIKGIALLWTKDDGKITDIHLLFDTAAVKVQLGVAPKELAALPTPAMASGAPQVFEQARSPEETANVATGRAWVDALEKPDEAPYLATVTDDVLVETPERPTPVRGKDDLKAHFKQLHKAIGQVDTIVENAWGIGKYAVVEYTVNGEQLGAIGWIPASHDRVVRLHAVDVLELRDGKIAHAWRYENPEEILSTTGM